MTIEDRIAIEDAINLALEKVEGVLKIVNVIAEQNLLGEFENTYSIAYITDLAADELFRAKERIQDYFQMVKNDEHNQAR